MDRQGAILRQVRTQEPARCHQHIRQLHVEGRCRRIELSVHTGRQATYRERPGAFHHDDVRAVRIDERNRLNGSRPDGADALRAGIHVFRVLPDQSGVRAVVHDAVVQEQDLVELADRNVHELTLLPRGDPDLGEVAMQEGVVAVTVPLLQHRRPLAVRQGPREDVIRIAAAVVPVVADLRQERKRTRH